MEILENTELLPHPLAPSPGLNHVPAEHRGKRACFKPYNFYLFFMLVSFENLPPLSRSLLKLVPRPSFQSTYVCPSLTFQPPYKVWPHFQVPSKLKLAPLPVHLRLCIYIQSNLGPSNSILRTVELNKWSRQ